MRRLCSGMVPGGFLIQWVTIWENQTKQREPKSHPAEMYRFNASQHTAQDLCNSVLLPSRDGVCCQTAGDTCVHSQQAASAGPSVNEVMICSLLQSVDTPDNREGQLVKVSGAKVTQVSGWIDRKCLRRRQNRSWSWAADKLPEVIHDTDHHRCPPRILNPVMKQLGQDSVPSSPNTQRSTENSPTLLFMLFE